MSDKASAMMGVTFAKGVLEDVAELTTPAADSDQAGKDEAEALKRRIAELLSNAGATLHRRADGSRPPPRAGQLPAVRFDIPTHRAKPRFRLIYRNEPTDGAPAECHWLTIAPRAGLQAHRRARQRS
jgi:hypothetical protein